MSEKIPMRVPIQNLEKEIQDMKGILERLRNGEEYITNALSRGSIVDASKGVRLYTTLTREAYDRLEKALFIHEFLTTGAGIMINREGRPIRAEDVVENMDEITMVNPNTLKSVQKLKEIFGEDFIKFVEFTK